MFRMNLPSLSAAVPDIDYTAMEARLRRAFADHQRDRARVRRARPWGRIAAAVLLTCGGAGWLWFAQSPPASLALESRSLGGMMQGVPVPVPFAPSVIRARVSVVERAGQEGAATVDPLHNAASLLADFIPLPGAAALPELERGDVVRIEVPIAGLAAYGFDMVPDATPASVAADLLIGQDGMARAIRLMPERVR
jgi:hypothetical protein